MTTLKGAKGFRSSHQKDDEHEPAPRRHVTYVCAKGCEFSIPFAIDAGRPIVWECRAHGIDAGIVGSDDRFEAIEMPRARTHWDMLLERRSIPELEAVLAERIRLLWKRRDAQ
ncbi:RNA polymerase-binding protein RbpA [Saccharopolyspora shandongensis]|uniref:RNA polymerase-binding protein RbpA n=1 Tax=Saccharopolyspora shandongensis TaxID=418495 RepID=UPI0034033A08